MKTLGLILFFSILLASCKKERAAGGCIAQTTSIASVSATDNATIQTLLNNNNLSGKNQVFLYYTSYSAQNQQNQDVLYQSAGSIQVRNGLPIFYGDLYYSFQNGVLEGISGKSYGAVSLDTKPSQTLPVLNQLFITEAVNKQGINASYKDSCYVAQFGYYDLNRTSITDTTTSFVKAWEVHPAHSPFPQCYIRDDNGGTLYFDSGIRLFYNANSRKIN